MPKQIKHVIIAITAAFLVAGIELFLQYFGVTQQTFELETAYYFITSIVFMGVLVFFIAKRHNSARCVFIVLVLMNIPLIIPIFIEEIQTDIIGAISTSIQTALYIWAIVLLLRKPVGLWFRPSEPFNEVVFDFLKRCRQAFSKRK